jgi:hypothetical protein
MRPFYTHCVKIVEAKKKSFAISNFFSRSFTLTHLPNRDTIGKPKMDFFSEWM